MRRPPLARVLRHVTIAPLFLALVVLVWLLSPIVLLAAAAVSLAVDRRWRPLRAVVFLMLYAAHDAATLILGLGLWLRLGGRGNMCDEAMQTRHYALIEQMFAHLSHHCEHILSVRVAVQGDEAITALKALDRPLIVLSRHAGPGDSFLLVHELLARGRRPRIVLRSALQVDPGIDLLGNRLPFCWVPKGRGISDDVCRRIGNIAGDMDHRGALLLFPEGGNFTRQRRRGSIRHLRRRGLRRRARQAADMQHLIAPRPGGVLAALHAAPNAAVVFVAHTGLSGMSSGLLQRVPTDRLLQVEMWLAPPEHIPATDEGRIEWLFDWWHRLDDWVEDNRHRDQATQV